LQSDPPEPAEAMSFAMILDQNFFAVKARLERQRDFRLLGLFAI